MSQLFQYGDYAYNTQLRLEGFSLSMDIIKNGIDLAKDLLPNILDRIEKISLQLDDYLGQSNTIAKQLLTERSVVIRSSKELPFLTFSNRYVTVPENFNGNFLEYGETLAACIKEVMPMQKNFLQEYNRSLSMFLTNKDDRTTISANHTDIYKAANAKRVAVEAMISKFYGSYTGRSRVEIKNIMKRMSELDEIILTVGKIGELTKPSLVYEMNDSLKECTAKLNLIIKRIRENSFSILSPERTRTLSEGTFEIAKFCEMVSILYFQTLTYCTTAERLVEHVKNCSTDI